MKTNKLKNFISIFIIGILFCAITVFCYVDFPRDYKLKDNTASIHLYGETHGKEIYYNAELKAWKDFYQKGNRILFVELPYYSAEYLNIWMHSSDDSILEELFSDWENTASATTAYQDFFCAIKKDFPETVFCGTDVGHQYAATGKRYLDYLQKNGQEMSEQYVLAEKCVNQGIAFEGLDATNQLREDFMTENFIDAVKRFSGNEIFGIYGSYHIDLKNPKLMAGKLENYFGDVIESTYVINLIANNKKPFTFGFGYMGLFFLLMMFIPNLIFIKFMPSDFASYEKHEKRFLQIFEKAGEVLVTCIAVFFTDFNPSITIADSFFIFPARNYYLILAFVLMLIYEVYWIKYFKSSHTMKDFYTDVLWVPLSGATLPVITFFILGIYGKNIAMILASIVLGIGHIGIHYSHFKNLEK